MYDLKLDKLYIVYWLDHSGDAGWRSEEDVKTAKPPVMETIGWLKRYDDEVLILHDTKGDGSGGESLIVPSCIVKVEEVWFPRDSK